MDAARIARQLADMAEMQDHHNRLVHPRWRHQGHDYYRAVWVECAELLDHFGWKWWKRQQADVEQVRLEIIDIWHFGLSELLRANQIDEPLAARLAVALASDGTVDFREAIESLALKSLATKQFDIEAFVTLMRALPMTFDELYQGYVAKNILNAFRQEHGYQDGSYRKRWQDGREDNEHLVEIVASLDADADSFVADLRAAIAARYALASPASTS